MREPHSFLCYGFCLQDSELWELLGLSNYVDFIHLFDEWCDQNPGKGGGFENDVIGKSRGLFEEDVPVTFFKFVEVMLFSLKKKGKSGSIWFRRLKNLTLRHEGGFEFTLGISRVFISNTETPEGFEERNYIYDFDTFFSSEEEESVQKIKKPKRLKRAYINNLEKTSDYMFVSQRPY